MQYPWCDGIKLCVPDRSGELCTGYTPYRMRGDLRWGIGLATNYKWNQVAKFKSVPLGQNSNWQ